MQESIKSKIKEIGIVICIFIVLIVLSVKNTDYLHEPIIALCKKVFDKQNLGGEELGYFTMKCVFLCELPILFMISAFILFFQKRIMKRIWN